jgi:hypothetical protein
MCPRIRLGDFTAVFGNQKGRRPGRVVEPPGIEPDGLPGNMPSELPVRYVSFQFSPARYLRFRFQVLTGSRVNNPARGKGSMSESDETLPGVARHWWCRHGSPGVTA